MNIALRVVTLADAQLLLDWRNDSVTRQFSHHTEPVQLDKHLQWLTATLNDNQKRLYIAEVDGVAVGTVRAFLTERGYELSWTVAPDHRGKGVGKLMVAALAEQITDAICAQVHMSNSASRGIAEHVGMTLDRVENDVLFFSRPARR